MASMIGYAGSLWLVAILLVLALGLAAALVHATRERHRTPARGRRPR
jgi:cbb3-type cytochrome oxidase subunit 3